MTLVTILTLALLQGLPAGPPAESVVLPAVSAALLSEASCGVADLGGQRIDETDVEALRALLEPVPGLAIARRLAVDTALATWLEAGTLEGTSAADRLAAYRRLIAEVWHDVGAVEGPEVLVARLREAAGEAELVDRQCPPTPSEAESISVLRGPTTCGYCGETTAGAWVER